MTYKFRSTTVYKQQIRKNNSTRSGSWHKIIFIPLLLSAIGVITNVPNESLTKPKLAPDAVSQAQKFVILNDCSILRKFLNFEDYFPNE